MKKKKKPFTFAELKAIRKRKLNEREWYSVRSIFGNTWAYFYILLGAREAGKSYAVMKQFIKDWKKKGKPFTWLRLTEASQKKMLSNNADKFIDADIRRQYDLDLKVKGMQVFDHGKPMAKVLALSTFYNDKGVALFDNEFDLGYNICLDEMNREANEKKTFDINYAFVNQMENLVRSTKDKLRIVLIGNTLEEAGDILCSFNFIPEEFGRYKIRKKKAVLDYIPPSKAYLERRKDTVADILARDQSTFTNKVEVDKTLVYKGRLNKPTNIIMFNKYEKYTIWDSNVIKEYKGEKVPVISMRAYIDQVFNTELRDTIISVFHNRGFYFRDLMTQKKFKKAIELLKPKG